MDLEFDEIFTEGSLTDSVVYQSFNKNEEMTRTILAAIKDSIRIDNSYIEEQILQIERTKISPLAETVLHAYESEDIVLLYNKSMKRIPKLLPFFVMKTNGKKVAFIFVNNYGALTKSDVNSSKKYLNISMKDLYVLMEGAYIALQYATYSNNIVKNMSLMSLSAIIYSSIWVRILNRNYAITMDPTVHANTVFAIARFFLERVWMYQGSREAIFNYTVRTVKAVAKTLQKTDMVMMDDQYTQANIETIEDLIKFIKELSPRFKDLSFRYFFECFVVMFKDPAVFGLESLPYFLFMVQATLLGSFLINSPVISDIIKNIQGMNQFYPELVRSIL